MDRLFVHPRIKRELCDRLASGVAPEAKAPVPNIGKSGKAPAPPAKRPAAPPEWLRLVRPWWGHHDHLHVRLKCPADSVGCESQAPLPAGDGCSELAWWESEEARRAREPRRDPTAPVEPRPPPPLPAACQAALEEAPPRNASTTAQRER